MRACSDNSLPDGTGACSRRRSRPKNACLRKSSLGRRLWCSRRCQARTHSLRLSSSRCNSLMSSPGRSSCRSSRCPHRTAHRHPRRAEKSSCRQGIVRLPRPRPHPRHSLRHNTHHYTRSRLRRCSRPHQTHQRCRCLRCTPAIVRARNHRRRNTRNL